MIEILEDIVTKKNGHAKMRILRGVVTRLDVMRSPSAARLSPSVIEGLEESHNALQIANNWIVLSFM